MFGGNLDGFTNGIFGGMQAVQRIAANQQAYQQNQYQLDAARAVQDASDDPSTDAQGDYTPDSSTATYGAPQSAIPVSSDTSAAPVADVTKAPPLPVPAKPQGAPDPDAVDPLAAGDSLPVVPATAATASVQAAATGGAAPPAAPSAPAAPAGAGPGKSALPDGSQFGSANGPAPPPSLAPAPKGPQSTDAGPGKSARASDPDFSGGDTPPPPSALTPIPTSPTSPSAPAPASTPAPDTVTAGTKPAAPTKTASLGASILSALNPVSSAQADTVPVLPKATLNSGSPNLNDGVDRRPAPDLPMAKPDTDNPPPASAAPPASGALADTIARMRQDVAPNSTSSSQPPPAVMQPLPRQAPGATPDTRTSDQVASRVPFDQRPYAALAQQAPAYADMVDAAANKYGVTPAALAVVWNNESGMRPTAPDSATGDMGPLQINKNTLPVLDPQGTRDPRKLSDALDLAAQNLSLAGARYGRDTPLMFAAYQGGNGSADAIANGEADHHPNTMAYVAKSFPGQSITPDQFQPGHAMSPAGIVQAAQTSGPDGVLQFIARSGPPGAPMSDKWHQAETALMTAAAAKGDVAGMQHARDFVFQMMHQGNAANMMNAYQLLSAGNTTGAAQALARANAFFPDGAMGRFGTDAQGRLWGQQVDEHDPTKPMGQPFEVTPEKLQQALIRVQDPNEFAAALSKNQQENANIRLLSMRSNYYDQLPAVKERIAAAQDATRAQIAQAHDRALAAAEQVRAAAARYGADSRLAGGALRASGGAGSALPIGANGIRMPAADAESAKDYSAPDPVTGATMPLPEQAAASQVHADLRMNTPGMTRLSAKALTTGLFNGQNVMRQVGGGKFGIFPRGAASGQPLAVIDAPTAASYQRVMMPSGLGGPGGALRQAAPGGAALDGGRPGGGLGYAAGVTVPPSRSAVPMAALPTGY